MAAGPYGGIRITIFKVFKKEKKNSSIKIVYSSNVGWCA